MLTGGRGDSRNAALAGVGGPGREQLCGVLRGDARGHQHAQTRFRKDAWPATRSLRNHFLEPTLGPYSGTVSRSPGWARRRSWLPATTLNLEPPLLRSLRLPISSRAEEPENSGKTSRNHTLGLKLAPDKWCTAGCGDRRVMTDVTWRHSRDCLEEKVLVSQSSRELPQADFAITTRRRASDQPRYERFALYLQRITPRRAVPSCVTQPARVSEHVPSPRTEVLGGAPDVCS